MALTLGTPINRNYTITKIVPNSLTFDFQNNQILIGVDGLDSGDNVKEDRVFTLTSGEAVTSVQYANVLTQAGGANILPILRQMMSEAVRVQLGDSGTVDGTG